MSFTLLFTDAAATQLEHSGGKGANLSLLTQRGFPVPPGFVIAASASREFLAADPRFAGEIAGIECGDPAARRQGSARVCAVLRQLPMPARLAAEVRERLAAFPVGTAFAVRSSSTMEDLASAAFAGQHDTYLNVTGADAILGRVRDCWLSLWGDRAMAYRHHQGFEHLRAAMAVVVQQMVPAEVAGVGFSLNPVSGDLGELVINANFGLGESVVSGEGEVDQWTLDKATLAVRTSSIAHKTRQVIAVAGGTQERRLEDVAAARPSLTPETLREVAGLLVRVEQSYQFPQDIEWALAGGRLFLLQSRPITTIPPRWTRDESAERFPNVLTPLTWDFVESGFHRSLNHSFRLMGFPPFAGQWFGMHGHYIYGNQNAVELYGRRAPFAVRTLDELRALIPGLRTQFRWVQDLPSLWARDLDAYLIRLGEFQATALETRSERGLWAFVLEVNALGADYFQPNIAISITHGTLYRLLLQLLELAVGADAHRLFDALMAYCETKTGVINKELFELADLIRAQPALAERLRGRASRAVLADGSLAEFPEVHARFAKFLRDHGHREVDFDAYVPTWIECPWVVLDNVRLMLDSPRDRTPAGQERDLKIRAQQAEHELFQRLPPDLHFFFCEILRLARVYTSLDDLEHYQTTRLTLPLRRGLRALGARWVARGLLDEPLDLFFARREQIETVLASDTDAARGAFADAVRAQKAAYHADRARKPDWILGVTDAAPAADVPGDGRVFTGLAGSPGVAEGPVFRVFASEDFARFPKGAVLVARTTNPTWTPLFYAAAAVVTESGGPLSHGAVTARELRIPAVMSVKDCLTRLRNGDRVRVEGLTGRVTLL